MLGEGVDVLDEGVRLKSDIVALDRDIVDVVPVPGANEGVAALNAGDGLSDAAIAGVDADAAGVPVVGVTHPSEGLTIFFPFFLH